MNRTRKALITLLILGIAGAVAGVGTYSAFSSTTVNAGNEFTAGTVHVSDNDASSAMYSVTEAKPGTTSVSCIQVTYGGSLPADVQLYTTSAVGALAPYVDLTIEKGTASGASFPGCGTFTSEGDVYTGTLAGFAAAHDSWANGASAYPGAQTAWNQNDTLVYRFTLTLQDDNAANGADAGAIGTGTHEFTWEARNQ